MAAGRNGSCRTRVGSRHRCRESVPPDGRSRHHHPRRHQKTVSPLYPGTGQVFGRGRLSSHPAREPQMKGGAKDAVRLQTPQCHFVRVGRQWRIHLKTCDIEQGAFHWKDSLCAMRRSARASRWLANCCQGLGRQRHRPPSRSAPCRRAPALLGGRAARNSRWRGQAGDGLGCRRPQGIMPQGGRPRPLHRRAAPPALRREGPELRRGWSGPAHRRRGPAGR